MIDINPQEIIGTIVKYSLLILSFPIRLFLGFPSWVKSVIYFLLVGFAILIMVLVWKYKDGWKKVFRT